MSEELKNCPFCVPDLVTTALGMSPYPFAVRCEKCSTEGPEKETKAEAIAAWNRRFVCPDKNGKAVYAGDRAKAADCEGKVDRLGGIVIESEDGHLHHVWPHEIELIESEADNDK